MEFKGSYGTVSVVNGEVYKREALYDNEGLLEISSITECAAATIVNMMNSEHLPFVEEIQIFSDDASCTSGTAAVVLRMPYYGRTLLDWYKDTPRKKKMEVLPCLIDQLVQACDVLLKNDIQHTDIKPANILISNSDDRLVLIDFNIYSVKTINGWIETVGTWCYVAPEILLDGIPSDVSMSWSIGMIIAEFIAGYPLGKNIDKHVTDVNSRKDWQKLYANLKVKFQGMPLTPQSYQLMPVPYIDLYNMCTIWDITRRASLSQIADYLHDKFEIDPGPSKLPTIVSLGVSPFISDLRHQRIDLIYTFCTLRPCMWNLLYRSIWLYDKSASNDLLDVATCICIAYTFIGYTIRTKFIKNLARVFNLPSLTIQDIEKRMLTLCTQADWKIYDKGADVLALERGMKRRTIIKLLPIIMKTRETEYDGYDIADAMLKSYTESLSAMTSQSTMDQKESRYAPLSDL